MKKKVLNITRKRRARRTRANLFGTQSKPRLSVFRSNRYLYVQLIDDQRGKTLVSASTRSLTEKGPKMEKTKTDYGKLLGEQIAEKAATVGITSAIFDRGKYKYHGRVKAIAEAARSKGLTF